MLAWKKRNWKSSCTHGCRALTWRQLGFLVFFVWVCSVILQNTCNVTEIEWLESGDCQCRKFGAMGPAIGFGIWSHRNLSLTLACFVLNLLYHHTMANSWSLDQNFAPRQAKRGTIYIIALSFNKIHMVLFDIFYAHKRANRQTDRQASSSNKGLTMWGAY